eukprot:12938588-Prorocentrum_lima.AAC.1
MARSGGGGAGFPWCCRCLGHGIANRIDLYARHGSPARWTVAPRRRGLIRPETGHKASTAG